jgi:hypothetical protein
LQAIITIVNKAHTKDIANEVIIVPMKIVFRLAPLKIEKSNTDFMTIKPTINANMKVTISKFPPVISRPFKIIPIIRFIIKVGTNEIDKTNKI